MCEALDDHDDHEGSVSVKGRLITNFCFADNVCFAVNIIVCVVNVCFAVNDIVVNVCFANDIIVNAERKKRLLCR